LDQIGSLSPSLGQRQARFLHEASALPHESLLRLRRFTAGNLIGPLGGLKLLL
jgi:hypothetical protein